MTFDPEIPLPGAPEPWAPSTMPVLRDGPPFAMTEMIAAEPALAERLLGRLANDPVLPYISEAIRVAAVAGQPIVLTGCGTSEHAAMVAAALIDDALRSTGDPEGMDPRVSAVQAFELGRRAPSNGVVLAISHEGGTWATNEALRLARTAGASTGLITVSLRSPGAEIAQMTLATGEQDQSWCHTVGYLSPILAATAIAGELRSQPIDPAAVRATLQAATAAEAAAESIAGALGGATRLLLVGSGMDYAIARELALKIEEGTRLPATAHQLETIRHGHLAAADEKTGLVMVLTDAHGWGAPLLERSLAVLRSARALAMPAALIVAADLDPSVPKELTPAGRVVVTGPVELSRPVAAALATAIPIQLIAERLARARGANPDAIGREDPRQSAAAEA
jgi:glucosamine 6-phosphate synthetase-like amidotransferase/phosphosugar isomerase protein